jgi:hypothetical protein
VEYRTTSSPHERAISGDQHENPDVASLYGEHSMSRHLVVGAGAIYGECKAADLPEHLCLPLISNFSQKMWSDYNPAVFLNAYLNVNGIAIPANGDAREVFLELERTRPSEFNIELFFEFAWNERERFPGEWQNLTMHGILNPLIFLLSQGLWSKGVADAPLKLSPAIAGKLNGGDVVLDLNYDTLFEIGAEQAGKKITFLPNPPPADSLWIAKPHGSFNMVVDIENRCFAFGELDWPGSPQPANGAKNYAGFIPPRFNKRFGDHPAAGIILKPIWDLAPTVVTFWGVGFTKSDADLAALYTRWCNVCQTIEVINPDLNISKTLKSEFGDKVCHFDGVEGWLAKLA